MKFIDINKYLFSVRNPNVIGCLVNAGADVNARNDDDYSALEWAVDNDIIDIADELVKYGANINVKVENDYTALIHFMYNPKFIKILPEYGTDVNARNRSSYILLMLAETEDVVKVLTDAGVNVKVNNSNKRTARLVTKMLLNARADINIRDKYGRTALMLAVMKGNVELVKVLLDCGADMNIKNNDGDTALVLARSRNYKEIIRMLEHCYMSPE